MNYSITQNYNIHALLTDSKFSNKLSALKLIYKEIEQSKITWAVYSSAAMFLLGITPNFNDWDLITIPKDADKTFEIFETLNAQKHTESSLEKERYFNPPCKTYTLKDTDFDVSPEFDVITFGTRYKYHLKKDDLEYITVDDISIPICPAEALWIIYHMMTGWQPNRQIKVRWLQDYLKNNLRHPDILANALNQNIPYWIKVEIHELRKF